MYRLHNMSEFEDDQEMRELPVPPEVPSRTLTHLSPERAAGLRNVDRRKRPVNHHPEDRHVPRDPYAQYVPKVLTVTGTPKGPEKKARRTGR